jgi:hypothetical protein
MKAQPRTVVCLWGLWIAACAAQGATYDEFRIKREGPFAFARNPAIEINGDKVVIRFKAKAFCDVTVAIEDARGAIVRHLASGVLGKNAPEPFAKSALEQELVWDGKDAAGKYVDDKAGVVVRVSLGLRARFERQHLWSPHRRIGHMPPLICAQPEGVYVFDGNGVDHLRLFDHDGRYLRTIHPFPRGKVGKIVGLKRRKFPQSGQTLPVKRGFYEATLLTSGFTGLRGEYMAPRSGSGATCMAVGDGRIALAGLRLNRLATDGSSGGVPIEGPKTSFEQSTRGRAQKVTPRSAALSPDGKTLYLAGFAWDRGHGRGSHAWMHGVGKVDLLTGETMELFAGEFKPGAKHGGTGKGEFRSPSSVACDREGRVYVADHFNNRVQVFDPAGTHLKSIAVTRPSEVCVDQKTGHIYVFSWVYGGEFYKGDKVEATLQHLGPFDKPDLIAEHPLPMRGGYSGQVGSASRHAGFQFRAAVDPWGRGPAGPTFWMVLGAPGYTSLMSRQDATMPALGSKKRRASRWGNSALVLLRESVDRLVEVGDFGRRASRALPRLTVPTYWRQRLFVRPPTGNLYVLLNDDNHRLTRVDPETGEAGMVKIPFATEDLAFDLEGRAYLRTFRAVARYDPEGWREIPFDYGEARPKVGLGWGRHSARVIAALPIHTGSIWHQGGIWVSPKGHVVVAYYNKKMISGNMKRTAELANIVEGWKPRLPHMFPGRAGAAIVRVWDRYGKVVYGDAAPGLGVVDGVAMDKDDNLYALVAGTRMFGKERYWDYMTGTLVKLKPSTRIRSSHARIKMRDLPERPPDTTDGGLRKAWYEGAEWFYGGLGFTGKDGSHAAGGCACWNARFAHDYFSRSFVPETQHYSVAALDTAGNLILRIGRYGNVDDGVPLARDEAKPALPARHSIGGDEVAFFYPIYLATHTDRRLFVADPGNSRVVGIKLSYHTTRKVPLTDKEERE